MIIVLHASSARLGSCTLRLRSASLLLKLILHTHNDVNRDHTCTLTTVLNSSVVILTSMNVIQTATWRVSWSHGWPPAREAAKKAMSDT